MTISTSLQIKQLVNNLKNLVTEQINWAICDSRGSSGTHGYEQDSGTNNKM